MKKVFLFFLTIILAFNFLPNQKISAENKPAINFFYSATCPHCSREKSFLKNFEKEEDIKVNYYLISENIELIKNFYSEFDVPQNKMGLVPITFIKNQYFLGYSEEIKENIKKTALGEDYAPASGDKAEGATPFNFNEKLKVPFLGEISPKKYSLPALSVILGFFDGFNVCSMGALIVILGVVLAFKDRKKILILGGCFILATAIVYGFLIVLWYQAFSFLAPRIRSMEYIIGALGILGGIFFIREFIKFKKYGPACEMSVGKSVVSKLTNKIKVSLLKKNKSVVAVSGIVFFFSAVIAIVEFPCSAAIPVFFAGILAEANLPVFLYLLYITIFVFLYLLDELIIFLIAFFTMKIKLTSPKITTWITLTEGILLLGLGLYYIIGI